MTSCYFCGCGIRSGEGYRRKVLTNESARIYFTKRGGGSYGQSYALRTLCYNCASSLDSRGRSLAWKLPVSLIMAATGIIGAVRYAANSTSPNDSLLGSLIYIFFLFGGPGFATFATLSWLEKLSSTEKEEDKHQELDSSDEIPCLLKKIHQSDFIKNAETEEERRGLSILFNILSIGKYEEIKSGEDFADMVIRHSKEKSNEEAKEFIFLLGRKAEESINTWYSRVSKLAPYELNTEDATAWLKYVYRMSFAVGANPWFGLDEIEEDTIKAQVLKEMDTINCR